MEHMEIYLKDLRRATSRSNIEKTVGDIVITNSSVIIMEVRQRWQRGESVNGGIIGRYRSYEYAMFKNKMNPIAGFGKVDLFLSGDLAASLTIRKTGKDLFQVYSTDEKYNKIGRQYGFEEFGLNAEQADEVLRQIYEVAYEFLLNEITK